METVGCTAIQGRPIRCVNWEPQTPMSLYGIAYGNGYFVAVGPGGLITASTDGLNWVPRSHPGSSLDLQSVVYGDGRFVAVGASGAILESGAFLTLALHLIANAHYGFFRDELYFIVCGRHPDWGYVDQPPLVPLLSR